jgi:hypothetical protein
VELPTEVETPLVEALAELAGGYPDRDVRARAADAVLVRTSRQLPSAPADEAPRLLAAVRRLAPEDRLLDRDTERYRRQHTARRSALPVRRRAPTLVARLTLPAGVEWSAAAFDHDTVYAAGWRENEVVVARCHGSKGTVQTLTFASWGEHTWRHHAPLQLVAKIHGGYRVFPYIPEGPLLADRVFPEHKDFNHMADVAVGPLPGMARSPLAALADLGRGDGLFLLERGQGQLTLSTWGPQGELWGTRALPLPPPFFHLDGFPLTLPVPMHYWGDAIAVGFLDHLVVVPPRGEQELVRLGRPVVGLCGGDDGLAVAFDEGGQFLVAGGNQQAGPGVALGDGLASPRLAFTGEGDLVAAAEAGCEVYEVGDSGMLRLKAALSGPRPRPVAVMPLARSNQFGLLLPDGVVEVYQVP